MNLIHLRSSNFFGGPERAILGQCQNMDEINFVCASFVRGDEANPFLDKAKEAGLTIEKIDESFAGDFRVIGKIRELILKYNASIIVSHDYKANLFAKRAVRDTSAKHIVHFRGYTTEDKKVRVYNYIDNKVLKRVDRIIVVSKRSGDLLESQGIDGSKIRVVYNAIEQKKLIDPTFNRIIDKSTPLHIVAAGRLSLEKGNDILVKAVSLLGDLKDKIKVDIYGHGPEESNLIRQINDAGLNNTVYLKGFVDNILPILKDADMLILPSRSEGLPNIVLEAWSQKLGVVSTAVGGVPEMMEHLKDGLLAEPENPKDLADRLRFAIDNQDILIEFGEKGYKKLLDRFSYATQGKLLTEIYREAVEKTNGAR